MSMKTAETLGGQKSTEKPNGTPRTTMMGRSSTSAVDGLDFGADPGFPPTGAGNGSSGERHIYFEEEVWPSESVSSSG